MMRKADVSFEELYNCYKVRFERFAISYIQDRSVAEDIVTDSFVYWWEHRDRVGSKDENPAAYILATIRHKCLNHLRALQVRLRSHNEIRESQSRIVQENIRSLELCDPVHLFAGEVEALVRQSLEELPMQHIYIVDYQRLFILIGTTSVFTSTQNVGTNAMCCISQLCIYVLYRLLSAILRNVRYQIQRVD